MIDITVHSILGIKRVLGQRKVKISLPEGSTVSDLIFYMAEKWGEKLVTQLFEPETNRLNSYIRLVVNGRDIAFLDNLETVLQKGDEVLVFPPVSGG